MTHKPIVTLSILLALTSGVWAEPEKVGTATRILTAVNGDYGSVEVKEPVHRNEQIRTSKSGLGEFIFRDGSKFAIGAGSVVKIDKFVYDDSESVQKFTIRATKGAFRWVSGRHKKSVYEIKTPISTIGIRGTKFDFYVGPDGTTALVMLSGSARYCSAGGCVTLQRKCDCVIARPGRKPTVSRANRGTLTELGNAKALPFLTGTQQLSGGFGSSTGCGMSMASIERQGDTKTRREAAPNRSRPDAPARAAAAPASPAAPAAPAAARASPAAPTAPSISPEPDRPSNPGATPTPNMPNPPDPPKPHKPHGKHEYGDRKHDHHHGRGGRRGGHRQR
jgi:hypothetical protein